MVNVEKSILLIVNNNSSRASLRKANRLERAAKNRGFSVEVQRTKTSDAAREIIAGDTSKFGVIGVVGGDGTVGPIAEELAKKKLATTEQTESSVPLLAVFGGGSTNVLRKAIGMPRWRAGKAIDAIQQGRAYDTSAMKVTADEGHETLALSNVSIGASAEIFKGKRPFGKGGIWYVLKLPQVIARARHLNADVTVTTPDGETTRRLHGPTDFFVHNGGPLGTFQVNPEKKYDSDYMETISSAGRPDRHASFNTLRALGIAVYDSVGRRISRSEERIRATSVVIDVHRPTPLQIEGDYVGAVNRRLLLEYAPDALAIVAPDQRRLRRRGFSRSGQKIAWTTTPSVSR